MIIDVFSHVLPPRYLEERNKRAGKRLATQYGKYFHANPGLTDLDVRFRSMDKYPGRRAAADDCRAEPRERARAEGRRECARIANDEMAELVAKHPDRFCGACACLPMNDIDAALAETDRAINDLRFRGVEIFTDHQRQAGRRAGDLAALREDGAPTTCRSCCIRAAPTRRPTMRASRRRNIWSTRTSAGPYETSLAMARLAFGGPLEKFPDPEDRHAPRRRDDSATSTSACSCRGTSTRCGWATGTTARR